MHLESFEHEQNIRAGHKNGAEYLECNQNAVRISRMHFEYPGIYTQKNHADGIPAHSASSVTRVLYFLHNSAVADTHILYVMSERVYI